MFINCAWCSNASKFIIFTSMTRLYFECVFIYLFACIRFHNSLQPLLCFQHNPAEAVSITFAQMLYYLLLRIKTNETNFHKSIEPMSHVFTQMKRRIVGNNIYRIASAFVLCSPRMQNAAV